MLKYVSSAKIRMVHAAQTHHHDIREAKLVSLRSCNLTCPAASHHRVLEGHDETLEDCRPVQSVIVREHRDFCVHVREARVHRRSLAGLRLFNHADDGRAGVNRLHDVQHLDTERKAYCEICLID